MRIKFRISQYLDFHLNLSLIKYRGIKQGISLCCVPFGTSCQGQRNSIGAEAACSWYLAASCLVGLCFIFVWFRGTGNGIQGLRHR